jgi:replicative DNA helicase
LNTSNFFNIAAEVEVLGSILLDNDSILNVVDILNPIDFYDDKHKLIYSAMKELYEHSVPINIVTLCDRLRDKLSQVGGVTYISGILSGTATAANISSYADIVKEKANCREIKLYLNVGLKHINEENLKAEEVISTLQNKLLVIGGECSKDNGHVGEALENVFKDLEERYKRGGAIQGIKSGYRNLDKMLCGFNRKDFVVLASRPSMGKTAMAVNLALNTAINSKAKVAFFNLEMGKNQVIERSLAALADVPMENIKSGLLTIDDWGNIVEQGTVIEASSLSIYDEIFTLSGIRSECKKLKLQGGLDIVIIDYLQLIIGEGKLENRTQEIAKISRCLKLLAKELDVTIIALSQLSRAPETRLEHRPLLSDLRESGSIEQDADVVMFLYRDEYYNKETEDKRLIECIIAKHRNGGIGTIRLRWQPEYQRIS